MTALAAKGVSVGVLAKMAGHARLQITQRYIDVNNDTIERTIEQQCERIGLKEQEERTIQRKRKYLKFRRI